ncbi:methyltransferase domain-containing protein [Sphingomonas piscis]|uniref:Methyltransferase domain-containing protein n=1 Tax=Sphingomonas piscis TaxID=2714943 RepID=A0A6G7YSZ1_9SPHN|nr:methyltransferase domain-containing protein [Sphingomonas piscis]
MSRALASTSKWDAGDYARVGSFVAELGAVVVDLLDPQPGERILDVGAGEGALTKRIIARGATVVGVDNSESMVAAAQADGLEFRLMAAEDMPFDAEFDAAFSNAALHWVLEKERAAAAIHRSLKPGARFVGEMGGEGNIAILRGGIRAELQERGYLVPANDPQWYASPDEFRAIYSAAGFTDIEAQIIPRPTPLKEGVAAWVKTFRAGWLDAAHVHEADRDQIAAAVERRLEPQLRGADGSWTADYVRLRFKMRKPS